MDSSEILLKCLKKKRIINDVQKAKSEVATGSVLLKNPKDLFIRDAITGMGTIMVEDLENHYYITSIKTGVFGGVLTYAIIQRQDESAEIAVYAHEGLIKQNLALKTIEKLKKVLC